MPHRANGSHSLKFASAYSIKEAVASVGGVTIWQMKTLKFSMKQAQQMLRGEMTETWRIDDDKDLSVDDEVECIEKKSGKAFGRAVIKEVLIKKYGDIAKEDAQAFKVLQTYYGDGIDPNVHIKKLRFTFTPYEQLKELSGESFELCIDEVKLYADGGSRGNPGPSATGYVLMDMSDNVVKKSGEYLGITTNNQAEYQAVKQGLEEAKKFNAKVVHVYLDSLLVVNQMKGVFKVKNRDLWPIYESVKELTKSFSKVQFTHIPRELNKLADAEVNNVLDSIDK